MQLPATIFREYDIRGLVGEELNPEFAALLGRAFGLEAATRIGRAPTLAVGRDNRPSGESLARAVCEGVRSAGGTALDIGEAPTPALYFAEHHLHADGGIQVTGSHNPPEFNGFKMVIGHEAVHGYQIAGLREAMLELAAVNDGPRGEISRIPDLLPAYRDAIVSRHALRRAVRVVVDCGNGVASLIAVSTLQAIGAEVVPLYCESDGRFPNHHPDPTVPDNLVDLQHEVRSNKAELGIAFDGDGDRIGAVDESGRIVWGDQLLIVLGRDLVHRFGAGQPVIFDVKCSELLPRALREAGAEPVMWKTGHSLIKAKMKELDARLAGEMSGHMFFGGDWYGFDDALFAGARLLEIVARGPGGLAHLLADLPPTFTTPEIRVACPEERKFAIVAEAAEHFAARYRVTTIDGVRIGFRSGWGLLRASNTQPVLVMRFEAESQDDLDRYQREMVAWLAERGIKP